MNRATGCPRPDQERRSRRPTIVSRGVARTMLIGAGLLLLGYAWPLSPTGDSLLMGPRAPGFSRTPGQLIFTPLKPIGLACILLWTVILPGRRMLPTFRAGVAVAVGLLETLYFLGLLLPYRATKFALWLGLAGAVVVLIAGLRASATARADTTSARDPAGPEALPGGGNRRNHRPM